MIQIHRLLWLSIPEYRLSSGTIINKPHVRQDFSKAFSDFFSFVLLLSIDCVYKAIFSLKWIISKSYNIQSNTKIVFSVGAKHIHSALPYNHWNPLRLSAMIKLCYWRAWLSDYYKFYVKTLKSVIYFFLSADEERTWHPNVHANWVSFHNLLKAKLSKINHPEKVKSDVSYILSHFSGGMLWHGAQKELLNYCRASNAFSIFNGNTYHNDTI